MNKILLCIAIIFFSSYVRAAEQPSSIDIKYKEKNSRLYTKYNEARDLLDSWRGQQAILSKAYEILLEITQ